MAAAERDTLRFGQGWGIASVAGAVVAIVVAALAIAIVVLLSLLSGEDLGFSNSLLAGGLFFYWFHRVGLVFDTDRFTAALGEAFPILPQDATFTVSLALMLGTVLALWVVARAGAVVADTVGGTPRARGLSGIKVAPAYAAVAFAASFLMDVTVEVPAQGGRLGIHPSYLGALLWPLGMAAVAGFIGGFRTRSREAEANTQAARFARGAVAGGVRMLVLGIVLAFVALLAMHPSGVGDYFEGAFDDGAAKGTTAVTLTALVVPNASTWILVSSMGGCAQAYGPVSYCFLSYQHFPGEQTGRAGPAGIPVLGPAPARYYVFLLVPLIAVVLGGMRAARQGGAYSRGEAAGMGATAGVMFAGLCLAAIVLATISIRLEQLQAGAAFAGGGTFRIGPDPLSGVLLALLWGVVGGAIGGALRGKVTDPPRPAVAWDTGPRPPAAPPAPATTQWPQPASRGVPEPPPRPEPSP